MIITAAPDPTSTPPHVQLQVTAIPVGTTSATTTRVVSGLPTAPVRGAENAAVSGTVTGVTDYEAPFGVTTTYRVTAYNAAGAPLGTAQTSIMLDVDEMWITDPLAPGISAACRGLKSPESFASITYTLTTAVTPTDGQELPAGLSGTRQGPSSVPLVIIAQGPAEAAPIRQVLRYANPFLLRCPIRWQVPLPPLAYCLAGTVTDNLFGGAYGRTHLSTTVDLVQPPAQTQAVALRTYADLLAEATSYANLLPAYTSYLNLLQGA